MRTARYTPLTFLPLNLFEQFRRIANFYFLTMCAINFVSPISLPISLTRSLSLCVSVLRGLSAADSLRGLREREAEREIGDRPLLMAIEGSCAFSLSVCESVEEVGRGGGDAGERERDRRCSERPFSKLEGALVLHPHLVPS